MPENTQITAIIPSKDRFDMVKRLISNIRTQNFDQNAIEIILIDDGSDPPYSFSDADNVNLIRHDISQGAQNSRNHAIKIARGKYIFMLDDDIELTNPDYLQTSFDILEDKADIAAVFSRQMLIKHLPDSQTKEFEQRFPKTSPFTGEFIQINVTTGPIQWGHQVYLVRTELLRQIEGFDNIYGLKGGHSFREESDVQARIRKLGYKLWFDESLAFNHHVVDTGGHGANIGKRLFWIAHNHIIFTKRHLSCWPLKTLGFTFHILRYSWVQGHFKYITPMIKGYLTGIRNALRDKGQNKNDWL